MNLVRYVAKILPCIITIGLCGPLVNADVLLVPGQFSTIQDAIDAAQDGDIVLRVEVFDIVRTIHMDPAANPEAQPATPLGYSVGRWEGDTLVIRTTRVSWPYFNESGSIPQSEAVVIDERFTVGADDRLVYEIVVTDPATFTAPVSARFVLGWRPDVVVEPYECIPGA